MHRNYRLLIILCILVMVSVALSLISPSDNSRNFRVDLFSITDTTQVRSIAIEGEESVKLARSENGIWMVNNRYRVNKNLHYILMAVLNQVNVKRPVSAMQRDEISEKLKENKRVVVQSDSDVIEFYVGGNKARTQSYFMLADGSEPYIVEIPGYRNYVSGIFELTEMQWRDRTLFSIDWRSLQELHITYTNEDQKDLDIVFEDRFFKVGGLAAFDTVALMSYMELFENFQANEFIARGFMPEYDSVAKTKPYASVKISGIREQNNQELKIYASKEGDSYTLVENRDNELAIIDRSRIDQLLATSKDFRVRY